MAGLDRASARLTSAVHPKLLEREGVGAEVSSLMLQSNYLQQLSKARQLTTTLVQSLNALKDPSQSLSTMPAFAAILSNPVAPAWRWRPPYTDLGVRVFVWEGPGCGAGNPFITQYPYLFCFWAYSHTTLKGDEVGVSPIVKSLFYKASLMGFSLGTCGVVLY